MSDVLDPPAPGRRERTKQANREAILAAARQVFGEMGYEAASVRDIIRRTPLSVGAFYNYFPGKDAVVAALEADGARRFRPILRAQRAAAADVESYIRGGVRAWFDFLVAEHLEWTARRGAGEHPHLRSDTPELRAVYDEVRESMVAVMGDAAPGVDADYLAAAAIAVAREVGDAMLRRTPVDVEGASAFCSELILGGLAALRRGGEG